MANPSPKKGSKAKDKAKKVDSKDAAPPPPSQVDKIKEEVDVVYGLTVLPVWKSVMLLAIAALWSPVSQLMLSPTHGSSAASAYHRMLTLNITLLTAPLDIVFLALLPLKEKPYFLPVLAASVPMIARFLTPTANWMGPVMSAFFIETCTYGVVAALTFNICWQGLKPLIPSFVREPMRTFAPVAVAMGIFKGVEAVAMRVLPQLIGRNRLFTRMAMPVVLALYTAMMLPSTYLYYAIMPLTHTALLNPHTEIPIPESSLNSTLAHHNYTLLARRESLTGYISVLQNERDGFRVMRCDHSLLGGEWVYGVGGWAGGEGHGDRRALVGEPVYSVFSMLEAVRLVHTVEEGKAKPTPKSDKDRNALVIGLGIGTTPSALVAHGINTTVVEIDSVVHFYARKFFSLPNNITSVIQDATEFVQYDKVTYDYIIHDVFTGGAEPEDLFTVEFIQALHDRLKPKGVIAINYASDLKQPLASLTVRTVLSVFPNCRIFREHPADPSLEVDFTNMIFYCRKGTKAFDFRKPVEADYLGSMARRTMLLPEHEITMDAFDLEGTVKGVPKVLRAGQTSAIDKYQRDSAVSHWHVMRQVLPPVVWENW